MRFDLQLFLFEQPFSPRTGSLKRNFDGIYAEIHDLFDNGIEDPRQVSATKNKKKQPTWGLSQSSVQMLGEEAAVAAWTEISLEFKMYKLFLWVSSFSLLLCFELLSWAPEARLGYC